MVACDCRPRYALTVLYVLIDDQVVALASGPWPRKKLPDAELVYLAVAQVLLGAQSGASLAADALRAARAPVPLPAASAGLPEACQAAAPLICKTTLHLAALCPSWADGLRLLNATPVCRTGPPGRPCATPSWPGTRGPPSGSWPRQHIADLAAFQVSAQARVCTVYLVLGDPTLGVPASRARAITIRASFWLSRGRLALARWRRRPGVAPSLTRSQSAPDDLTARWLNMPRSRRPVIRLVAVDEGAVDIADAQIGVICAVTTPTR